MKKKAPLSVDWKPVRPALTSGVRGLLLRDGGVKIVLTRVAPGGCFDLHRDAYGHFFHVRRGQVLMQVGETCHRLTAGDSLEIAAGDLHGYENDFDVELELLSVNIAN